MKKKLTKKAKPTPEYDSERETRVLLEKMGSDVKAVAEGHSSIVNKLEEHDKRFDMLETAVIEVDAKAKRIEQKLDSALTDHEQRIKKVEEKVGT